MINKKNIHHHFGEQPNLSQIFNDFFYYFKRYSVNNHYIFTSRENIKLDEKNIFHYHKLHNDYINFIELNSLCTIHHKLDSYLPFWNGIHWVDNIKKCKKIVCLNTEQKKYLNSNDKVTIIPHGYTNLIKAEEIEKKILIHNRKKKISLGLLGKFYQVEERKGEKIFLELLNSVSNLDFKFILLGENKNFFHQYLNNSNFEYDIFPEFSNLFYKSFYKEIDYVLNLTPHEGGPAFLVEALSNAVPLITKKGGMVQDYCINNFNSYVFENFRQLTQIMKKIKNKFFFKDLCLNTVKTKNLNSWQEIVKKYDLLYSEIC